MYTFRASSTFSSKMTLRTADITHIPAILVPLPMDMATDVVSASGMVWSHDPGPINTWLPIAIRSSPLSRTGYIRTVFRPKCANAPETSTENTLQHSRTDVRYTSRMKREKGLMKATENELFMLILSSALGGRMCYALPPHFFNPSAEIGPS